MWQTPILSSDLPLNQKCNKKKKWAKKNNNYIWPVSMNILTTNAFSNLDIDMILFIIRILKSKFIISKLYFNQTFCNELILYPLIFFFFSNYSIRWFRNPQSSILNLCIKCTHNDFICPNQNLCFFFILENLFNFYA